MKILIALVILLLPTLSYAASRPVEASMVVTGTITVNPDGSVQGYDLREQRKLPPLVLQIVKQTVPHWQFKPIIADGQVVTAKTGMSLRIVADMADAKHATIRVAGAEFGCNARTTRSLPGECPPGTEVLAEKRTPPDYPVEAARMGVSGEVFLVLQIGRDGHVTQAAARQVNLYRLTDDPAHFRKILARASLKAARSWQFKIPTVGPEAAKQHWLVQVPVNYTLENRPRDACGAIPCSRQYVWKAYVPGPVRDIPWSHDGTEDASRSGTDAVAGGAIFTRDNRFVLQTPLAGGPGRS